MSVVTEEYIRSILEKVTSVHKVKNWHYTQEKFKSIAQNYFGIIIPVILSGERNGEEVKIKIVLKLAPTDDRYRVSGALTQMFAREIFAYDVLLKSYEELQARSAEDLQYIIPHCYYLQKEYCSEAIVMQNMVAEGFRPFTQEQFLDLDHITISLQSLAKLHALSFILEDKNHVLFNDICKTCVPLLESTGKRYFDVLRDRLDKAMSKFENTEYVPLLQMLKDNSSRIFENVVTTVMKTCICHGDIWKENILYTYKDNKPESVCLIDYQSTRVSCPAFDTLYLILSSTSSELRQQNYNKMLDMYYETFSDVVTASDLEPTQVYSRTMFEHDLKVVAPACIVTANCALWLSNGLQIEGHVRSKVVWVTEEEKDMAVGNYKRIVKAIIDDCCNYGYISLDVKREEFI